MSGKCSQKDRKEILNETELFVLDMDGTFYLGEKILPGALEFLKAVRETGKEYIFFTNNSSKSPELYIKKLAGMNCRISRDKIMTSGDVTIQYIKKEYPGKKVYLLGTKALEEMFLNEGICLTQSMPDLVVVGFDMTLTYEKLERACRYINKGAVFLATHPDINCPVEEGFIPDCGAFCAAIITSTGIKPHYLGKPNAETLEAVLKCTGYSKEKIAFVGDRVYTDVATGVKNGARGILVLSGETKKKDIFNYGIVPDAVFESIGEMAQLLQG